jgi:predicted ATPase
MTSDAEIQKLLGDDPDNGDSLPILVERCRKEKGSVIPFVGAGLSKSWGFPLWDEFLKASAANHPGLPEKIQTRITNKQYEEAASDLMAVLLPSVFENKLAKAFGDSVIGDRPITGAVAQLARFPVARIITTNFDRVLETCFRQHNIQLPAFPGSKAEYGVEALQQSKPFLLKLHGDWEDFADRILTLEEYQTAYGNSTPECADTNLPLPHLLSLLLETRCLLFFGCSLAQDRTMQVLHHVTKQFQNRIYHFAIVERPDGATPGEADAAAQKRKIELDSLSIIPIWYPHGKHNLIEAILGYLAEKMEEVFPPARTPDNIPDLGSATVGRQEDIDELTRKLQTDRLITILGAGGCGKSRLSIEVAKAAKAMFPDGVWYVALSDLSAKDADQNLLASQIGRTIGLPERRAHTPSESLLDYFGAGKHLLVLDNCEHLVDSCRELSVALLSRCSGLTILATSRAILEAYPFERVYPLNPLSVPAADKPSLPEIRGSSAVQLFIDRARVRLPDFDINSENATAVAAICQALCGIPLAIEIAAALLDDKTVWEISAETSHLLDETASGDLRHWKTMNAAIGWSYSLLTPELQVFLRRLSVFRGGWTPPAAAAVCNPEAKLDQSGNFIKSLLDSSLIIKQEVNKMTRFRFLEPIRQFAQQQLTPSESESIQRQHAVWFLGVAEESAPKLLTGEQNATLDALQTDLGNFRAAVRWTIDGQQPETGLRLMVALWRFTEIRAYYTEGLARAREVLAIPGTESFPVLKCRLLSGAGMLAYRMADFARANSFFQECFDIAKSRADQVEMADALSGLGLVAMMKGSFPEAQALQTQCRDLERLNHNPRNAAVATYNLGFIALGMGSNEDAARLLEESRQQFESAQNDRESAFALDSLARCRIVAGDLDTANQYAHRALDIRRKLEDGKCVADSLRTLAWAALEAGNYEGAVDQLKEGIGLARDVDDSRGVSEALELFALISAKQENQVRLVVLAAAAENIRGPYGYALPPSLIAERDSALTHAKERLGTQEYSRAWALGGTLDMAKAIEEALQTTTQARAPDPPT